jgi:hypothetical protein
VFRAIAVLLGLAAVYHFAGFLRPDLVAPAPKWRHAAFIAIDWLAAWLLVRRPGWLIWPFAALTINSVAGHAWRAWTWWTCDHTIDWTSIGTIVVLPVGLVLLYQERREYRQRPAPLG